MQVSGVAVDKTMHVSAVAVESKRSSGSNKIGFILNKRISTQYQLYTVFHNARTINNDPAYQKLPDLANVAGPVQTTPKEGL